MWRPSRCATITPSDTDEKSSWTQTPRVEIRWFLYQTWPEVSIINYYLGPQRLRMSACLFPLFSLSSHVAIICVACSWHRPKYYYMPMCEPSYLNPLWLRRLGINHTFLCNLASSSSCKTATKLRISSSCAFWWVEWVALPHFFIAKYSLCHKLSRFMRFA